MILMGLDPGLLHTGWGVIEKNGHQFRLIAQGTISPKPSLTLSERLAVLHTGLTPILTKHHPDCVGVEEVFSNKNPKTTLKLGEARGISLLAPALLNISVIELSATAIKKSVVGVGHADKNQVQMMTRLLLGGQVVFDSEHAADALATAIATAHHLRS